MYIIFENNHPSNVLKKLDVDEIRNRILAVVKNNFRESSSLKKLNQRY